MKLLLYGILGFVFGVIIGFLVGALLGVAYVNIANVSNHEGGQGFAVMAVMMLVIPVTGISLCVANVSLDKWKHHGRLLKIEGGLAAVSLLICLVFWYMQ